jgi:mono/diheme cytochrome c family protein
MARRTPGIRRLAAAAGLCVSLAAGALTAFGQAPAPQSVRDGVFSVAQVERGRDSFTWVCMNCHELEEFTGVGAYLEEMEGETVWEVFEYIWAEMPEDDPASLEPTEYADVLAYILSVYGLPAGDTDMPTDRTTLEAIKIARPVLPGS